MSGIDVTLGEHVVLLGETGSGKTETFKRQFMPKLRRLLIVDSEERQFNDIPELRRNDGHKVARVIPRDLTKGFRWRVVPPPTRADGIQYLEDLMEGLVNRWSGEALGKMAVYIDEGTDFSDAHSIGEWFGAAFRKLRKREVSIFIATQRPQGLSKWAEGNATHELIHFVRPFDRKYLGKLWPGLETEIEAIPYRTREQWPPHDAFPGKPAFLYIGQSGEIVPYLPA